MSNSQGNHWLTTHDSRLYYHYNGTSGNDHGDTAICVHPDDERYKHLQGKFAFVPLINRRIPIIADEYVTMEFGTGAWK